jgi:hypothetical protein
VGRKEPGRDTGPTFESALGKPAAAVLGVIRSGEESRGWGRTRPTQPGWTIRLCGRRRGREDVACNFILTSFIFSITCKGDPYPENGAQRRLGRISYVWASTQGRQPVSFVIPLRGERTLNENKSIKQSGKKCLGFREIKTATGHL